MKTSGTKGKKAGLSLMNKTSLIALTAVQGACALFFVLDILLTIFGARTSPLSWKVRELLEIGAAVGLILGATLGMIALRTAMRERAVAEESLRVVRTAFQDHLQDKFGAWGLTGAERDVALFSLKGLSVSEIASVRDTSEGTVKAQSNAIYRKAGVNGRAQLMSLFIEDLMLED